MDRSLKGVFAPIVTVFDENERVCLDDIAYNIHLYNETPLAGYMPLGSNGEFLGLTEQESLEILHTVCGEREPERTVVCGCGRESVCKTLEFIEKVAKAGADYAFILPPHYFVKFTDEAGLEAFYLAVAERSPLPIVVYNAPKFASGIEITPRLCAALADHPNIAALKNSSTRQNIEFVSAVKGKNFKVIAGNIDNFYEGITAGAVAGVLSTASYLPDLCCRLYDLILSGNLQEATDFRNFITHISKLTAGRNGVAGVKCAMDIRGFKGGRVRLPLHDLGKEYHDEFFSIFSEYGIGPIEKTAL